MAVQRFAKKLLAKYWGRYTALGDTFLENLQGLTTAKIYQADEFKHEEMNEQAEEFRRITMKVLTMQLNSITVMDLIAYGGAALGVVFAVTQIRANADYDRGPIIAQRPVVVEEGWTVDQLEEAIHHVRNKRIFVRLF